MEDPEVQRAAIEVGFRIASFLLGVISGALLILEINRRE